MCALLALAGCTKGAKGVDEFFGQQAGDIVQNPAYQLNFDPPTFDFGDVLITNVSPQTKTINVSNTTGVTLFVANVIGASSNPVWTITNETCSLLAAGLLNNGTCHFTLNFQPTASGRVNYNVNFKFGVSLGDVSKNSLFTAFGRGMTPANLSIATAPFYDFGSVVRTATATKQITIANNGDWPATTVVGSGPVAPFAFAGGGYPGTGGNCGATIPGNSSCTVGASFAPPATGLYASEIDLSYFDGDANQTAQRNIQGTGALPAVLAISDGPSYDFGAYPLGAGADKALTITNSGGVPASSINFSGLTPPFIFKGGSYPGTGGTCGATIAAGASCQVVVRFSPTALGAVTTSADMSYFDGLNAQTASRSLTGTGVAPAALTLSNAPALDFGTAIVGSTNELTLTVSNVGGFAASAIAPNALTAPFSYKGGAFPGVGGTCAASLASSASCTVVIRFAPTAAGSFSAQAQLSYNNGATTLTIARNLLGSAVASAALSLNQAPSFNFGSKPIGSSTDQTLTVANSGGTTATAIVGAGLTAPFSYKGGSYPGTGGTCGATIAASAVCTIVVNFAPSSTGAQTSTAQINYFDGLSSQIASRALNGAGVTPASLAVSDGPTYDFGSQPIGATILKSFTLTNSGGFPASSIAAAALAAPFGFAGSGFPGTGGTCGATLPAGASCTFVIAFQPSVSGASNATIALNYNDGNIAQSTSRAIAGAAVTPALIAVSDGPVFDFGPVASGASFDKSFTLTNSGQFLASAVSGAAFTGPFSFKGGVFPGTGGTCGSSLSPAAACTVVVTFAPAAVGTFSGALKINYANGVANVFASRSVQGIGTSPALLTVSDGPSYAFGSYPIGAAATKILTVTNSGGVTAQSISGGALGAPYSYVGGSFPGTGGTCGATLSAAGACTVAIQFSPAAAGLFNSTLIVSYSNTVQSRTAQRDLTGSGVQPATLAIAPTPTADFGVAAVGGAADLTLTMTNGGQFAASTVAGAALSAPFAYKGGSYPGTGGTCAGTLASATSCTIVATFSPTVTGSQTGTLTVNYFDGAALRSTARPLAGSGAAPASITIGDGPIFDFGTIASGATVDHAFTVANGGGVSATGMTGGGLSAPFRFKGGAFPGTGGTCASVLAAGASCTVVTTYAPTAAGSASGALNINYLDGAAAQTAARAIAGTAVAPALLAFSDAPLYDYGTIASGASSDHQFTISNSGAVSATGIAGTALSAPFAYKGGAFPGVGGTCGGAVVPGGSCTVTVTFHPTASGARSGIVGVAYNDGVSAQSASRSMQGAGASPGSLLISDGPTYDFGSAPIGGVAEKTFFVTNQGGVAASTIANSALSAPFTFKGGAFPGTGGTCAATLNPTATCSVVVQFAPTAAALTNATLGLSYNDGVTTQTSSRPIKGTGVQPATLAISDIPNYDYGTVATGGVAQKTFSITNSGSYVATSILSAALTPPFAYKAGAFPGVGGSCGASLNAGATCTVVVTYAPTATGAQTGTIVLSYFDGAAAQSSSRGVQGTGATPALLSVSDGPTYDFGVLAIGGSADKAFTVANSGGISALSLAGGGLSAPYRYKGGSYPGTGGTCGSSLAAGASCTVVATYAPSASGTQTSQIDVGYNTTASARKRRRAR